MPPLRAPVLALALAAAATAFAPAAAAAAEMEWKVLSRFGGDLGDGLIDKPTALMPAELDVYPVALEPAPDACRDLAAGGTWTVDGRPHPRKALFDTGDGGCRAILHVRGEGKHTVKLVTGSGEQSAAVDIDDRLVIALGDSVASGEGNPLRGGEPWLDEPCHRSPTAGFEQAARLIAGGVRVRSITFVSLACSGATVDTGLLGPYSGVTGGAKPPYEPQVTRLKRLFDARALDRVDRDVHEDPNRPRVDAILLSIGANDVEFSKTVVNCAFPQGDCRDRLQNRIFPRLEKLSLGYDRLQARLAEVAPGVPVLVTEYFDPTRDESGAFCPWSVGFTRRGEVQFAFESLLTPLNIEVAAAASRHRWTLVGGIAHDFQRHGYCSSPADRWVRGIEGSLASQRDHVGTLHPNARGHLAIADRVAPALARTLRLDFQRDEEPEEGWSLAQKVELGAAVVAGLALLYLVLLLIVRGRARRADAYAQWTRHCLWSWRWSRELVHRLWHLVRPTDIEDPCSEKPGRPVFPRRWRLPGSIQGLVVLVGMVLLGVALLASMVGLVGGAILWVRFWAARLPADQAVDSVAKSELVTTGAGALVMFALLGLVALSFVAVLDGKGQWGRATRRGLVVIIVVELLAAILLEEYAARQRLQLLAGFVLGALLLHFLVDRALRLAPALRARKTLPARLLQTLQGVIVPPGTKLTETKTSERAERVGPALVLAAGLVLVWISESFVRAVLTAAALGVLWLLARGLYRARDAGTPRLLLTGAVAAAATAGWVWLLHHDGGWERVGIAAAFVAAAVVLSRPGYALVAWRALPLAVLCLAVYCAAAFHEQNRLAVPLLIALAAVLFVVPGSVGGTAFSGGDERATPEPEVEPAAATPFRHAHEPSLEPGRFSLAAATFAALAILLARDEWWLAAAAAAAVLLAGVCLAVAAASGRRFAPYGVAVLLSVPMFGAVTAMLQAVNSPELQPIALLLDDGRTACGSYVGETRGRVWVARVELAELGHVRRPRPRRGQIFPIRVENVAERVIGPMQPIARAQDQALELRGELLRGQPDGPAGEPLPTCVAPRRAPKPAPSEHRKLAEKFQPELVVDRRDGFWPIPVTTLFAMQDRRARACRLIADNDRDRCVRLTTPGQFPWSGGIGEAIEYPAANDRRGEQRALMVDALGSVDPARSASIYFLRAGPERKNMPITLQYWFFYSFNYQPLDAGLADFTAGFHEGDFESVGVLLSGREHRPRYVWMARHEDEHRMFTWDEFALQKRGDHVRAYAARGSHATYESCQRQSRFQAPGGLIDDRPTCEDDRQLHLVPEVTPMIDLSRTGWACWGGRFGHRSGPGYEKIKHLVNDAPISPLWQQDFGGGPAAPCEGLPAPPRRESASEEVVSEDTGIPKRIRERAGRLEALVDDCSDWESPPADGTYVVACDQDSLRAFAESGFEDPGDAGVRIDRAAFTDSPETSGLALPQAGELTLPAVARDAGYQYLDRWRIAAVKRTTTVSVFASCPQRDRMIAGRFGSVDVEPGEPLRIDDHKPGEWRLRTTDGRTVATTVPVRVRGPRLRVVGGRRDVTCRDPRGKTAGQTTGRDPS